jgi:hypothetical protein
MRREDRSSISTYPPADLRLETVDRITSSLAPHTAQFLFAKNMRIAESSCRPPASCFVIFAIGPPRTVVISSLRNFVRGPVIVTEPKETRKAKGRRKPPEELVDHIVAIEE